MKKIIFTFSLVCISIFSQAQAISAYVDTFFTDPYSRLSNTISVNNGVAWDDPEFRIPLGFSFQFFNDLSDSIGCNAFFNPGAFFAFKPFSLATPTYNVFLPYSSDIVDKGYLDTISNISLSPISYKTEGTAPNRIFKLEYRNIGFPVPISANKLDDSLDLQMWLYETKNYAEVRFGNVHITSPNIDVHGANSGPGIVIAKGVTLQGDAAKLYGFSGDANVPDFDSANNINLVSGGLTPLDSNPQSNMVYRFVPVVPPVTPANLSNYNLRNHVFVTKEYDNLMFNNLLNENVQVSVTNIQGQEVQNIKLQKGKSAISMQHLTTGVYLAVMQSKNEKFIYKFNK
jgi:hypothetical protein